MDITYFESGYIEDGFFTYTAEGTILVAFNSNVSAIGIRAMRITADPLAYTATNEQRPDLSYFGNILIDTGPQVEV